MKRFWRREQGQTLVLFALCLVVLMGMLALAIDAGYLYYARTSFQRAADAGALAGGSGTLTSQEEARSRAIEFARYNLPGNFSAATVNVSFPTARALATFPTNSRASKVREDRVRMSLASNPWRTCSYVNGR